MGVNGRKRARFVLAVVCAHNAVTPARRRRPKRIKATSNDEKELREIPASMRITRIS